MQRGFSFGLILFIVSGFSADIEVVRPNFYNLIDMYQREEKKRRGTLESASSHHMMQRCFEWLSLNNFMKGTYDLWIIDHPLESIP